MNKLKISVIAILCSCSLMAQKSADTIEVGLTIVPPFISQNNTDLDGINIWLWEKVAKDLDINFKYKEMAFHEMLAAVEENAIQVSINPITITSQRNDKLSFTLPFYVSNSTIAIKSKSAFSKIFSFLRSFFNYNFLSILAVFSIIMFLFGLITWRFEKKINPEQFRPGWKGLWDGLWWSAVTVSTVGYGDKAPKSGFGKLVSLLWMFLGLLLISGLTASVASSLTVSNLKANQIHLEDFKGSAVGTVANTSTHDFLKVNLFDDIHLFDNIDEAILSLQNEQIDALFYDEPILKDRLKTATEAENIEILPSKFDLQMYAFALSAVERDLADEISQKILMITESLEWRVVLKEYGLSAN